MGLPRLRCRLFVTVNDAIPYKTSANLFVILVGFNKSSFPSSRIPSVLIVRPAQRAKVILHQPVMKRRLAQSKSSSTGVMIVEDTSAFQDIPTFGLF